MVERTRGTAEAAPGGPHFTFRPLAGTHEVARALILRRRVYASTPGLEHLRSLAPDSPHDADAHDLRATHIGLFACAGGEPELVGTLRVVDGSPSDQREALLELARGDESLRARLEAPPRGPLPMLEYLEQAPAVRAEYARLALLGRRLAEPSRLCVDPTARVAALRRGVRLSHLLVLGAIAFGWDQAGFDTVLVDCDERIADLYRPFGFHELAGAGPTYQPRLGISITVLRASPATVPLELRPRVEALATQWREREALTFPAAGAEADTHEQRRSRRRPELAA